MAVILLSLALQALVGAAVPPGVPPEHIPNSLEFTDTDLEGGYLMGTTLITTAANETDVDDYAVYIALSEEGLNRTILLTLPAGLPDQLVSLYLPLGGVDLEPLGILPGGSFYLIAYSRNTFGETRGPVVLSRDRAVPTNLAKNIQFSDQDMRPDLISGKILITAAEDDSDIEDYVIYRAMIEVSSDGFVRWSWPGGDPLEVVPKPVARVIRQDYDICRCRPIATDKYCTDQLRFLGDGLTPSNCTDACLAARDCQTFITGMMGTPREGRCYHVLGSCNTLAYNSGYQVLNLTRGFYSILGTGNESECPCGRNPGILERRIFPTELSVIVPKGTPLLGATHLAVITRNRDGEMSQGRRQDRWISMVVTDRRVPIQPASGLTYVDLDPTPDLFWGFASFLPASREKELLSYRLYVGERTGPRYGDVHPMPLESGPFAGIGLLHEFPVNVSEKIPEKLQYRINGTCPTEEEEEEFGPEGVADQNCTNGTNCSNSSQANTLAAVLTSQANRTVAPIGTLQDGPCLNNTNGTNGSNLSNGSCDLSESENEKICGTDLGAASHLIVRSAGIVGEANESTVWIKLIDNTGKPPSFVFTSGVSFRDENPNPGILSGTANITVPKPEPRDIESYRIYFMSERSDLLQQVLQGGRNGWIAEAAATGNDVAATTPASAVIPVGATRLVAVAVNANGLGPVGRGIEIQDVGIRMAAYSSPVMIVVIVVGSLIGMCILFIVVVATRTGCAVMIKREVGSTDEKKKKGRNAEQDELDALDDMMIEIEKAEAEERASTPMPSPQPSKKRVRIGGTEEEEVHQLETQKQSPFPKPNSEFLKISDPRSRTFDIGVLGFSDGHNILGCDLLCKAKYLGNSFDIEPFGKIELEAPCQPGHVRSFCNAEAAFCALKFWTRAGEFSDLSGEEANELMRRIDNEWFDWKDPNNAGFGSEWNAMLAVLEAKFEEDTALAQSLLDTGDAFLLYHAPAAGDEDLWSDNFDGSGLNWLGLQLMLIRDRLASTRNWTRHFRRLVNVDTGDPWSRLQEDQWRDTVAGAADVVEGASEKTKAMAGIVGATPDLMTKMIIKQTTKKGSFIL